MRLKLRWLMLAGLVVGVGAALGFRRSMAQVAALLSGSSRMAETAFGTVEYAIMGSGSPVMVLHGAGGGFDQGLDTTATLASKGYRLIAPSRFGYLRSAAPVAPSPAAQADACSQMLDQMKVRQTVVLGISAGSWSALQFAARYPERCRALVLLVPAGRLPAGTAMYGGIAARLLYRSNLSGWLMVKLATAWPQLSAALLGTPAPLLEAISAPEKYRLRKLLRDLLPVRSRARGMALDIATAKAGDDLALDQIACPVLTISAEDDAFGTAARARQIAAAVPDGRVVIYPTGGHALVERHEEVIHDVVTFLAARK